MRFKNFYFFSFMLLGACQGSSPRNNPEKRIFQFEKIKGIKYQEVRRAFDNDIAFNDFGFEQEPEWAVQFLSDTLVKAYSPSLDSMITFPLIYSHGAVYNFARNWFRVKKMSKDSLVLQRLEVNGKVIAHDIRSNVYMTFYSEDYLKKIHQTVAELRKPRPKDSAFVRKHINLANAHPLDSAYFFAARNPVKITSESKIVKVEKISNVNELDNHTAAYDYLYPEYRITIHHAYKDFGYTVAVVADVSGILKFYRFQTVIEEPESQQKVVQGILDVYVKNLCRVIPGQTLGMPHASVITLDLIGKKD
ncbi:MAG: hypothetical protein IE931_05955 [Sphingobacteriales bacterium]|nr:hypothetical protein [Sphingobacteriales bacterium]